MAGLFRFRLFFGRKGKFIFRLFLFYGRKSKIHFRSASSRMRSDVYSTISSADSLWQLNHAHKSWPTLSIV